MIHWLENWYSEQCDGDWEHDYGISIQTLDNPGWNVTIELEGTGILLNDERWKLFEESDENWYGYKIENNVFNAAGDPHKLNLLLKIFKEKIESI